MPLRRLPLLQPNPSLSRRNNLLLNRLPPLKKLLPSNRPLNNLLKRLLSPNRPRHLHRLPLRLRHLSPNRPLLRKPQLPKLPLPTVSMSSMAIPITLSATKPLPQPSVETWPPR